MYYLYVDIYSTGMSEVSCKSWSEFWNQLFSIGFKLVILISSSNSGSCGFCSSGSRIKTEKNRKPMSFFEQKMVSLNDFYCRMRGHDKQIIF